MSLLLVLLVHICRIWITGCKSPLRRRGWSISPVKTLSLAYTALGPHRVLPSRLTWRAITHEKHILCRRRFGWLEALRGRIWHEVLSDNGLWRWQGCLIILFELWLWFDWTSHSCEVSVRLDHITSIWQLTLDGLTFYSINFLCTG